MQLLQGSLQATVGRQYNSDLSVSAESQNSFSPSVRKGYAGTLSTRTDNNTGVITVDDADHDITTADLVAIFWEIQTSPVQASAGRRRLVTVTAVAGAAITVDLGSGDNLPILTSAVIITPMEPVNVNVDGDDVEALLLGTNGYESVYAVVADDDATLMLFADVAAEESYIWISSLGTTNPVAGSVIGKIWCSHNNVTAEQLCFGDILHS